MNPFSAAISLAPGAVALALGAAPALAEDKAGAGDDTEAQAISAAGFDLAAASEASRQGAPQAQGRSQDQTRNQQPDAAPAGGAPRENVFDDNWATIGIGAGLVPTYAGSDNFQFFPLPLIVGRVGGVGFRPAAAGLTLDVLSPQPTVVFARQETDRFARPDFPVPQRPRGR